MFYHTQLLAEKYNLLPGDVVIAKRRKGIALLDHYIVYLGENGDTSWYIANLSPHGVKLYSEAEVRKLIDSYYPVRIRRFEGSDYEREQVVNRALSLEGKQYHFVNYNCEHFANYVQYGNSFSKQSNIGIAVCGLAVLFLIAGSVKA